MGLTQPLHINMKHHLCIHPLSTFKSHWYDTLFFRTHIHILCGILLSWQCCHDGLVGISSYSKHHNLLLVKEDWVIGEVCFRMFPSQNVLEIVFCEVSASQQVKVSYSSHFPLCYWSPFLLLYILYYDLVSL